MNRTFIEACDTEIAINSHKGDWDTWEPNSKELSTEMAWHYAKFTQALLNGDEDKIKEYACDMAMYCEKAFTLYNHFDKYDDGYDDEYAGYNDSDELDCY